MAYLDYDGDTTGKVALLDKVKVMLAEIYTTYVAEIEAARDGEVSLLAQIDSLQSDISTVTTEVTNARDGEANLLAQIDSLQSDISTVTTEVTNARDGELTLLAQIDALQLDIASLTNAELPGQTGNAGALLTTDATNASWTAIKTINSASVLASGDLSLCVTTSNLSDLANADTALTNLGGSVTGTAVFKAANAAAARTTLSVAEDTYAVPSGGIIIWSGSSASIPTGWVLCNGANSTPDLRNMFVVGAGSTYSVAATGGSANAINVSHSHSVGGTAASAGDHIHTLGYTSTTSAGNVSVHTESTAPSGNISTSSAGAHTHSVSGTANTAGSSGTGANLPPYYALCYIMKT